MRLSGGWRDCAGGVDRFGSTISSNVQSTALDDASQGSQRNRFAAVHRHNDLPKLQGFASILDGFIFGVARRRAAGQFRKIGGPALGRAVMLNNKPEFHRSSLEAKRRRRKTSFEGGIGGSDHFANKLEEASVSFSPSDLM